MEQSLENTINSPRRVAWTDSTYNHDWTNSIDTLLCKTINFTKQINNYEGMNFSSSSSDNSPTNDESMSPSLINNTVGIDDTP